MSKIKYKDGTELECTILSQSLSVIVIRYVVDNVIKHAVISKEFLETDEKGTV